MRKQDERLFGPFAQAIDEFFDELLIDRWRGIGERFEHTEVTNHDDHYEIRLSTEGLDPGCIEVESLGQRVTVRASIGENRRIESSFRFAEAIDADSATARHANATLIVTLPKQKARRIF